MVQWHMHLSLTDQDIRFNDTLSKKPLALSGLYSISAIRTLSDSPSSIEYQVTYHYRCHTSQSQVTKHTFDTGRIESTLFLKKKKNEAPHSSPIWHIVEDTEAWLAFQSEDLHEKDLSRGRLKNNIVVVRGPPKQTCKCIVRHYQFANSFSGSRRRSWWLHQP